MWATNCFSCSPPDLSFQNESPCFEEQKVKDNQTLNYTLTVNAKPPIEHRLIGFYK
jgi:hypothetical protein